MFFGLWAMFFLSLTKRVFGEVVITTSCVSIGKIWWEKKLFWKTLCIVNHFETLSELIFRNLSKTSWQVCNDYSLRVHTMFLKKNFSSENFSFILSANVERNKFWSIVKRNSGWLSKLHFTCPQEHFERFLSKNHILFLILASWAICLAFYWKNINEVVRTALRVSIGTLW